MDGPFRDACKPPKAVRRAAWRAVAAGVAEATAPAAWIALVIHEVALTACGVAGVPMNPTWWIHAIAASVWGAAGVLGASRHLWGGR